LNLVELRLLESAEEPLDVVAIDGGGGAAGVD